MNVPASRTSRLLLPTCTPNSPLATSHACELTLQVDRSRGVRRMSTVADAPGASSTFLKPFNWRGGSPALGGNSRYSCATSAPWTVPLLVKVKLQVCWLASSLE